jgi:transposase
MSLRERYQVILLCLGGHPVKEISKIVRVHPNVVRKWITMYNRAGIEGLKIKKQPGRPPRLNNSQMEDLKKEILKSPREFRYDFSNWDGRKVQMHIKMRFGVTLGIRQVERILHKLGFSLQRPRPRLAKADPSAQKRFKAALKKKFVHSLRDL